MTDPVEPPARPAPRVLPHARRPDRAAAPRRAGHLFVVLPFALVLLPFLWLVTCGTWRLFAREDFGQFYDAQGESLLRGHWDVPAGGIGFEAFRHDGKHYGYFGFAPALARIILNTAAPTMRGCWSRSSLTLGCAATLAWAYLLLLESRRLSGLGPRLNGGTKALYSLFLIAVGLGSTLIFLASRAYVYHEATVWGAALALGFYYHLLRYLRRPTGAGLAAACLLCFGSFFCRASVGSGTILALLLLALNLAASRLSTPSGRPLPLTGLLRRLRRWPAAPPPGHAAAAAATVLAVVAVYVAVNRAKFGTTFDGMPFRLYNQVLAEPRRMARTRGRAVSWANVRTDAFACFSPGSIRLSRHFPWVFCASDATFFSESRFDIIEPYSSLTASMPALLLLSLVGLRGTFGARRDSREGASPRPVIPVLGAMAGASTVLLSAGISERYLHDFLPLLVLAGAFGLHDLLAVRRPAPRRCLLGLAVVLTLFSVYVNGAFALVYQRVIVWNLTDPRQAEARKEFAAWQRSVDGHFGVPPIQLPTPAVPSAK